MDKNFASNDSIPTVEKHHRIVSEMCKINCPARSEQRRKVQKSMAMQYGVIPTPDLLYKKHIQTKLTVQKAILLSLDRIDNPKFQPGQYIKVNTVFDVPQKFYLYPKLHLIISSEPVKAYKVVQIHNEYPTADFLGYKWAVFSGEPPYHFFYSTLQIAVE